MFKKLDYVYAVYHEGSFTRAAERLFISQPSLSAAIKNLEGEIGAPLFDRGAGGVALTEVGKAYIDCAERMMKIREEFVNKLNDINTLEVGHITVGGTNYLSSYVLPRIINRFTALYPKIDVTLSEANSKTLGEMMANEEIDLVIDSFDDTFDDYDALPLMDEEILLCVPRDYAINSSLTAYAIPPHLLNTKASLASVQPVPLARFAEENFILLKAGNDMHNRATATLSAVGISPKVSFYVDQMNISYALAEQGMGVCFATDTLFRFSGVSDKITLYRVSGAHSGRTLYVAYKKNRYCTRAMEKFIRTAQSVITNNKTERENFS